MVIRQIFGYQKKDKYSLVIRRRTNIDWLLEEGQI